jgi:hypothetical protein
MHRNHNKKPRRLEHPLLNQQQLPFLEKSLLFSLFLLTFRPRKSAQLGVEADHPLSTRIWSMLGTLD